MGNANFFNKGKPMPGMTVPKEHRGAKREPLLGVTVMVRRMDGGLLEGVVQDVSDGGIRISGDPTGLKPGAQVELVLLIQGERVGYQGEVRYVDASSRHYGLLFRSGPRKDLESNQATRQCRNCRRDFPIEHNFCSHCGQKLIGGLRGRFAAPGQG